MARTKSEKIPIAKPAKFTPAKLKIGVIVPRPVKPEMTVPFERERTLGQVARTAFGSRRRR